MEQSGLKQKADKLSHGVIHAQLDCSLGGEGRRRANFWGRKFQLLLFYSMRAPSFCPLYLLCAFCVLLLFISRHSFFVPLSHTMQPVIGNEYMSCGPETLILKDKAFSRSYTIADAQGKPNFHISGKDQAGASTVVSDFSLPFSFFIKLPSSKAS